jgi:ribosomal protein S18 acetylase RimI-like enzyme
MSLRIREMTIDDHESVRGLWEPADGVDWAVGDGRTDIMRFLRRNPALSLVAEEAGGIVGAVLCGHDGRRGYVHHLAVDKECRGRGIGRALVERCRLR